MAAVRAVIAAAVVTVAIMAIMAAGCPWPPDGYDGRTATAAG
ncbi:hypothetical protein [Streptomyces celluloflavus]